MDRELSRWLSQKIRSLSRKGSQWLWSAPIQFQGTHLFWYVQHRNQGLQFLLKYITEDSLVKGNYGFEAEFNKGQTSSHLKKPSVLGSDSALYFCAVRDTAEGAAGKTEYKPLSTEKPFSWSLNVPPPAGTVVPGFVTHYNSITM